MIRWANPLQTSFWLLVSPSIWRKALYEIDPTLPVDFSIAGLTPRQRENRLLWRFLLQNYLLLIILNLLIVFSIVTLTGASREAITRSLWLTFSYSLTLPLAMGYAFGGGSGLIFGGSVALGIGLFAQHTDLFFMPVSIAGGLAGCVLLNRTHGIRTILRGRQLLGMLTGLISAIAFIYLGISIVSGKVFGFMIGEPGHRTITANHALILALTAGIVYAVFFSIALSVKVRKSFLRSLPAGAIAGMVMAVSYYLYVRAEPNSFEYLLSAGIGASLLMFLLFSLPWSMANWAGGPQAAAVAAALVTGSSWVGLSQYLVIGYSHDPQNHVLALIAIIVCLSMSLWRPVLFLPLTSIWNNFLYSLEHIKPVGPLKYFKYHAVFWDEAQVAHWPGLEDYLLLQADRDPQEYEKNAVALAKTRQRGIVQRVEIELVTRKYEGCRDIQAIANVHRYTQSKFIDGPAAVILRTFNQMSHDTESALNLPTAYQSRLALGRLRSDLNLFQRELIFTNHPFTQWFNAVLGRWDAILDRAIDHLAQTASFQHEIINPYICGVPLNNEQEVFVGRTDIMARIERFLTEPHRPPLHLYGQRRMGKTSLLLNLDHYLPSSIISVFLDGQALGGYHDAGDVFTYITQEIRSKAYRQRGLRLPGINLEDNSKSFFYQINEWLRKTNDILAGQNLYVLTMLDEFEVLNPTFDDPTIQPQDLLGLARFIVQHRPHIKTLFVGSHSLDEIGPWSTFLFNAQVVKIGRLGEGETLELIENPVKNFNLKYDPEASARIVRLTSGHPHLVQSICFELVMLKNEQNPGRRFLVTLPDVEEAAHRSLNSISFFFADIRNSQIDQPTAAMLDYLADRGEDGAIEQEEWAARFPTNFNSGLNLALKRDLIERVDGGYQFQVEMIRRWFAARPF